MNEHGPKVYDLIIKGGEIVDGTGNPPFVADIAIRKDRIVKIAGSIEEEAAKVIDAKGKTVTPGLIDGHTHSELNVMYNRQQPHALYQGITTIVTGQCGLGFAPMSRKQLERSIVMNSGIFADQVKYLPEWNTFDEYLELLGGAAINVASNVSHNAIREYACGYEDKKLEGRELEAAKEQLEKALSDGATGLSVGLSYYPGGFSDTEELIELCKIVKKYDGVFCVHQRLNDGSINETAIEEVVRIVDATGVRLNMLHYRTGGTEDYRSVFEPFRELTDRGADIYYEFYPYLVGAGLVLALLPGWAQEGGPEAILERLKSPSLRPRLLEEMKVRNKFFFSENQTATVSLTKDPYSKDLGKTFREISRENNETFQETVIRLLIENELQAGFVGVENISDELKGKLYEDQYRLFLEERYTVGSDTIPDGVLCHPRACGAFARTIRMMRDRGVSKEFIIRKLSALPAKIYQIKDRGMLKEGYYADICVMDYENVTDRATFSEPRRRAEGVETVLVNGLCVLENGSITGILSGARVNRGVADKACDMYGV